MFSLTLVYCHFYLEKYTFTLVSTAVTQDVAWEQHVSGMEKWDGEVSVIRRLVVHPKSVLLVLLSHLLSLCRKPAPISATEWFTKGHVMCYNVYVIMHVKDSQLSVIRVGHYILLAGVCLYIILMF